jgi:protein-disulfide isomerase
MVLAAVSLAAACRSEPAPRARRAAQGATEGGSGIGVPTACTDDVLAGGLPLGDAPRKGSSDPLVAVVQFSNLECPECIAAQPRVDEILARYPQDVALYYVHIDGGSVAEAGKPIGRMWRQGAQAALAAHRAGRKFWEFMQAASAAGGRFAPPDLERFAQQVGVDVNAYRGMLGSAEVAQQVDAGQALALELGVRGPLPMFWVNGTLVQASELESRLAGLVEEKLRDARQALAQPRSRCEVLTRYVTTRPGGGSAANLMAVATGADGMGRAGRAEGGPAGAAPPQQPPQQPQEDPNAVYRVPVDGSPSKGPADALATLVLFTDFRCGYCNRVNATLEELLRLYPQDLRLVYKNHPRSANTMPAEAAMAAFAQGKFWEYHDLLFANSGALERADLERYAEQLGLDMTAFRQALDSRAHQGRVEGDLQVARRFGIRGTPTFFLNGKKFSGALPIDQFRARIDQALAEARALVQGGTSRTMLYDKMMAAASESVVFLPMAPGAAAGAPSAPPGPPPPAPPPPPLPDEVLDVKVEPWNPSRGPANAQVTVVLFCEYLCPFCKRVQGTLDALQQAFGNRIRFVFRNLIVHEPAEASSLGALAAARQGRFEEFHRAAFEDQGAMRDRAGVEALAQRIGLDMNRFRTDMDSPALRAQLDADKAEGARLGATGTPTLFLNGRRMVGARPPSHFGAWVDQLLGIPGPTIPVAADPQQQAPAGGCGAAAAPPPPPSGGGCGMAAAPPPPTPAPAVAPPVPQLAVRPQPANLPAPPTAAARPAPQPAAQPAAPRRPRPTSAPAAPAGEDNPY